jgi:hypothetical protein
MHKNIHRMNVSYISKGLGREPDQQPRDISRMVMDAVVQYNEMVELSEPIEYKDVDERLVKEAEEESTKVFLDGILDMIQRWNS